MIVTRLRRAVRHLSSSPRRSSGNTPRRRVRLRLETLEGRALLSLAPAGFALPNLVRSHPAAGATPLSSAGPTGYSPAQVAHAYGVDQVTFNAGATPGDGSGTTIAIVDAYDDPNIVNDLHQFDLKFALPDPTLTKVNQSGGTAFPVANAGWITEIALDVEWAHAIAPKANILLVEANDSSLYNLFAAVDYARRASGVVAVSMSWGSGEFSGENSYDGNFTTPSGHAGVTFLASSGDSGSPVSYPAISPNVVSVGGTSLNVTSQGGYISEAGWGGSGGGGSAYEAQPSYQKGIVTQSTTARTNPDVAYDSSPSTGFPVYDSYNNGTVTPWGQWGGTSAAAPQWAALVAIADQGRALAGKTALDGPSQTLPLLYSVAATDFHDVTTGTSTGTPNYTAGAGYDLVTGRGTPYANLLVNDLVGTVAPASATHFSVAAPSASTAGASFSVTVTALDASNNPIPGYVGTVKFTSSDLAAVLPASYTFTAADQGSHTVSGVTLKTAGSQSVKAIDTASSTLNGTAPVAVSPAAASHLVFGQQPTNSAVGAPISPAVTVRVFDAYNNLVTTDNTDAVTISLGANPGAATLGGTTTVTVSGGVAIFNNLTISQAGTGDTLIASTAGAGTITSTAFNVTAFLESFESGTLAAYTVVGATSPSASVSTAARHDGTYGLIDNGGNDWIYRNDAASHVKQGDTISVWVQFSGAANGSASFGFGATASGTLSLVASPGTNQLNLLLNNGYNTSTTTVGTSPYGTWKANSWYRLEVAWGTTGAIVGKLFDSNGTTLLAQVKGTTTAITSGGIAFKATGTSAKYWDTVSVQPGVNPFAALAPASAPARPSAGALADAATARLVAERIAGATPLVAADLSWRRNQPWPASRRS